MSTKRVKHVSLPLKRKYEIALKLTREKVNMSNLAKKLKVPRTTLNNVRREKDKIISEFEAGAERNGDRKRKRPRGFDKVDEPLLEWFRMARNGKIPVSGEMLLLKAQQLASICGYDDVNRLDINWVNRWKSRERISCPKPRDKGVGEVGESDCFKIHLNKQEIFTKCGQAHELGSGRTRSNEEKEENHKNKVLRTQTVKPTSSASPEKQKS